MSAKDISGKRPNRKRYSPDKDDVHEQDMNGFNHRSKVAKNYFRSFSNLTATNIRPPNNCAQNVEDISDHYYGIGHLNDNEKRIIKAYEQDMELRKRKKKMVNNCWKPHKCSICKKAFCHESSLKQHSVDVHDEKKAQTSKKKKSKKKNKHLKDENVAEVEEEPIEMKEEPIEMKEEPLDTKKNLLK